jgi:uncharacterized surface protein with fasciclin (FAS1) repeats
MNTEDNSTQDKDIVVNAVNAGNFTLLSNALKAADLVTTYKGIGPFTFFAPTDDAFRKLPKGKLESLLKDRPKLAAIINSHVMKGAVLAKDLKTTDSRNIQGLALRFEARDEGMTVNGARVTKQEIEASNGIIHGIDTVLMPKD